MSKRQIKTLDKEFSRLFWTDKRLDELSMREATQNDTSLFYASTGVYPPGSIERRLYEEERMVEPSVRGCKW